MALLSQKFESFYDETKHSATEAEAEANASGRGLADLRRIGEDLDRDRYPDIWDGGLVSPGGFAVSPFPPGELKDAADETRREPERGSATGSWQRAAGWQGAAGGSGAKTTSAPSVLGNGLDERYEQQISEVELAYPGLWVLRQPGGLWLSHSARLVPGISTWARFVTAVPYDGSLPKSWAFWNNGQWIGPRHTNFPDGSICAYDVADLTWRAGGPLVDLLDLFTLWSTRHLHLRHLGRWPGRQVAHHVCERLTEVNNSELCGCGSSKRYEQCCKTRDSSIDLVAAAVSFACNFTSRRQPPREVFDLFTGRTAMPPQIESLSFFNADEIVFRQSLFRRPVLLSARVRRL